MSQWSLGNNLDFGCYYVVKYYYCGVFQYWCWDLLQQFVYWGEQFEQDQNYVNVVFDIVVGYFGYLDYVVVLCEGGVWKSIEYGCYYIVDVICQDIVFQLVMESVIVNRLL